MSYLASLRDQLFILAGVEHDLEQELVPAFFGNGVAKKGVLNGVCYFLCSDEQDLKVQLKANLNKIRDLFDDARERMQNACIEHFESLQNELSDEPFDNAKRIKAERRILHICTYLNPFIMQLLKEHDLPYLRFLNEGLDVKALVAYFSYAKMVVKAKNLELTTGVPVPIKILSKLDQDQKLNAKETDVIEAWLKTLEDAKLVDVATFRGNKKNPYVQVHSLHRFLCVLAGMFHWDVANLELKFYDFGCTLFYEPDPYWMKVRKKTRPGDIFHIQGKDYVIDTCLVNPGNRPDCSMRFSLQNEPGITLLIAPNEAFNEIQLRLEERGHYGVMMPRRLGRDRAVSLIERTYHPLNAIIWTSNQDKLCDQDLIQAHPIVELLTGLCKQPCTPSPLTPSRFAFTIENEMRALEIMRMQVGKKSFETLEDFAWQCALNQDGSINPPVFSHLMIAGQLVHLPQAKSYHELMIMALKGKEMTKAVSQDGIFTEPDQLEARKVFFLLIQELKEELTQNILSTYQVLDLKKLEISLVSAFEATHLRDSPGRLLLPGFLEECKLQVLLDLKPRMHASCLSSIRKALIDKISQCDLKGAEAQAMWQDEKTYNGYGIYNINQQTEIYFQGKSNYKLIKKY